MREYVRCEHCSSHRRRSEVDRGKRAPFYCDDVCRERYETIGVLMKCPCPCARRFGSRDGFGMFYEAECRIRYAPIAAQREIEGWQSMKVAAAV